MKDLSKRQLGQLSKMLDDAQSVFYDKVYALAAQVRDEILPYFKKHSLDYVAGNGTWIISRLEGRFETSVGDDELPKNIRDLLMLEVAHGDHLGFYVRDIKRGEW